MDIALKLLHTEIIVVLGRGNLIYIYVFQWFIIDMLQIQRLIEILFKIFLKWLICHHFDDFRKEKEPQIAIFVLLLAHLLHLHGLKNVETEVLRDIHVLRHPYRMVLVDAFSEDIRVGLAVFQQCLIYWHPSSYACLMGHDIYYLDVGLIGAFQIREIIAEFAVETDFSVVVELHHGKSGGKDLRE